MPPFRLSRVLRLKEQLRRLRQSEAEALVAHASRLADHRRELGHRREQAQQKERRAAAQGIGSAELAISRGYDEALAAKQANIAERQAETREALARKRDEVTSERREERKFLRLGELHVERERKREATETERLLDELAGRGEPGKREE
jgi:flagellar export protein FliJ